LGITRAVVKAPKFTHITPILKSLQWLKPLGQGSRIMGHGSVFCMGQWVMGDPLPALIRGHAAEQSTCILSTCILFRTACVTPLKLWQ